jgi:hypothetical protein
LLVVTVLGAPTCSAHAAICGDDGFGLMCLADQDSGRAVLPANAECTSHTGR